MSLSRFAALCASALVLASPGLAAGASVIEREFEFPAQRVSSVEQAGITEVRITGSVPELTPGRPDLPWISETIDLPVGSRIARVEVVSLETATMSERARLASALLTAPEMTGNQRSAPDPEWFSRSGFQPETPVRLGYQGFQRGRHLAYLQIAPVRWDAASGRLERISRLRVRLELAPETETAVPRLRTVPEWETSRPLATQTAPEAEIGEGRGATPFKATQIPSVLGSPVAYVIITNDAMASEFQRLADWKTQTGVPAVVRTMSFIRSNYPFGADDAERVRNFIRDAYSKWGTTWVLLGGDTDIVPARYAFSTFYTGGSSFVSDLYFSCLEGNWNADGDAIFGEPPDVVDMLPEVWVGRAPTSTVAEADLFVDKSFQYVRTPAGDYENRALLFAEVLFPSNWAQGNSYILDGASLSEALLPSFESKPLNRYVRLYENHTDGNYKPGALPETKAAVLDSLNRGYNVCVHIGHGYRNVMSVGDDNIDNYDALNLTNGNRLFNLYASNCTSNAIDFPCIGESFIHAPNGGAVTVIGGSDLEFPAAGRFFQEEYFRLLFEEGVNAVAEAQGRSKLPFVAGSNAENAYRWSELVLLLLGDPELRIYTELPKIMTVTHAGTMVMGDTTFSVNVTIGGSPLQGARVAAYKANDDYRVGTTNAAGNVVLKFRPESSGNFFLTVTGADCRPYQATVNLTSSAIPVLADQTPLPLDDDATGGTSGNGNGQLEVGETVDLKIPLRNNGTGASANASGVNATLSTTDPWVTLVTANVGYGSIAAGATQTPQTPLTGFRFSISPFAPDQHEIPFQLRMIDGAGRQTLREFQLVIRAPELRHYSHSIVDLGGNTDARPDVGETVKMTVNLRNLGTGVGRLVTARLRSLDGLSTISDSTASWGDVGAGQQVAGDEFVYVPSNANAVVTLFVFDLFGLRLQQPIDISYPGSPQALEATGNATSVRLVWSKSPYSDLIGYNIYRSTAPGGPFTKINTVPTARTSYYLDSGLAPLSRFYYQTTAVDSSGNESSGSSVATATTSPPLHSPFPIPVGRATPSSPAVNHIYPGYAMDIVVGADKLYVWHSDGTSPVDADGSVLTSGDFTTLGSYYSAGPSIADLNNDGAMEILAPTWDSKQMFVFDQAGQPKPGWPVALDHEIWSSAAVGNFDNTGTQEMVFGSNGRRIYAFRADGTEWIDGDAGSPAFLQRYGVFKLLTGGGGFNFGTPSLADLDGDGGLDIIYGATDFNLYAWRTNGANLPGFPVALGQTVTASTAIGYLDGAGDPQLDIVVLTSGSPGNLYAIRADGTIRPGFPVAVHTGGTSRAPSPALAKINGDDFVDIVVASTNGAIYVYDRNGAFVAPFNNVNNIRYSVLGGAASESSPVVADIDGDGVNDIVMGDEDGTLSGLSGTGTALPGFPLKLENSVKGTPALCDCDGDGMSEIVVAGWDSRVHIWDYDFPFSPGAPPPWAQFHHDAARTGLLSNPAFVGVDDSPELPAATRLELAPPYPNPARARAVFSYAVPADRAGSAYEIGVYDLSGRLVRSIERGVARAGRFSASWNLRDEVGSPVSAGLYFLRLSLGSDRQLKKFAVLR